MEHVYNGVNSLTSARIRIRTDKQLKIEGCVKVVWESGSCHVWVSEIVMCGCRNSCEPRQNGSCSTGKEMTLAFNDEQLRGHQSKELDVSKEDHVRESQMSKQKRGDVRLEEKTVANKEMNNDDENQIYVVDLNEHDNLASQREIGCRRILGKRGVSSHLELHSEEIAGKVYSVAKTPRTEIMVEEINSPDTYHVDNGIRTPRHNLINDNSKKEACLVSPSEMLSLDTQKSGSAAFDPMLEVESRVHMGNQIIMDPSQLVYEVGNFDPMVEVEARVVPCLQCLSEQPISKRKPRGKPKRTTCSLPNPLYVPSTPSKCMIEAKETWNVAKSLGITASNEEEVISELRKSKRIMALERNNPVEG